MQFHIRAPRGVFSFISSKNTQLLQIKNLGSTFLTRINLGIVLSLILTLTQFSGAEKVGKLYYQGHPSELHGSTVQVPGDIVALSENINFQNESSSLLVNSSSIFFVIDNSNSMFGYYDTNDELLIPRDPDGNRFEVTKAIVDTLANNPEKYPGIECGLALFNKKLYFDNNKDKLLETVAGIDGGYLPLLKLDSLYESDYGLLSPDSIFHKYLATKEVTETKFLEFSSSSDYKDTTVTWTYKDLLIPTPNTGGGTNIDVGYKAALAAMKKSRYDRKNQFIVFISDGESSKGSDDYEKGVIAGTDTIPTTFTVFFTQSGVAPQSLEDMNEAIKNNGYSESNKEYTQIWKYKNSSSEELISFFMENIVSVFEGEVTSLPVKLDVKGSTIGSHWDSTTNHFVLDNIIPLTSDTTDISFSIDMEIMYDTLDDDGNKVTLSKDSTIEINNSFWVDPKTTHVQKKFTALYWDRNIAFENREATSFDIVFTNDPMKSDYEYENCIIEIKTVGSGDIETYTLSKDGAQKFRKSVDIKSVGGSATTKNGILEYNVNDRFIATFRNSETISLPLDTLVKEIEYDIFQHTPFKIDLFSTTITPDEPIMKIQLKLTGVLPEGAELSSIGNIYDHVGNLVASPFDMEYDKTTNSTLYEWDGKNFLNRDVGSGAYWLIVYDISITYEGDSDIANKDLGIKQLLVGVQR